MNAATPISVQHGHHILTKEEQGSHRWTITAPIQESKVSHRPGYKNQLHAILSRKIYTNTPGYKCQLTIRKIDRHDYSRMTQLETRG